MADIRGAVRSAVASRTWRGREESLLTEARRWVRWLLTHGLARLVLRGADRRGELQGRLAFLPERPSPEALESRYTAVRERGAFFRSTFGLVTAQHAVCHEVLTSGDFVSMVATLGRWAEWLERQVSTDVFHPLRPPSLMAIGPPDHTRYRSLISQAFTVPTIRTLRGGIEDLSVELLDGLEEGEEIDLVRRYCRPMPLTLVCDVLGIPLDEVDHVQALGEGVGRAFDMVMDWRSFRETERALAAIDAFIVDHIETLRTAPGTDLLSHLLTVEDDLGRMPDAALVSFASLVFSAGFETTVSLVASGIRLLVDHPDQLELLREQPELWPDAVDEILRLETPAMWTGRVAARDTEVAGQRVPKGTAIGLLLSAANRDPAVFPDPDRMDITRPNVGSHLAFSAGRHYCFGAVLGRLEGTIALRELFERFDVEILPGALRSDTSSLHGWERLPAVLKERR